MAEDSHFHLDKNFMKFVKFVPIYIFMATYNNLGLVGLLAGVKNVKFSHNILRCTRNVSTLNGISSEYYLSIFDVNFTSTTCSLREIFINCR